MKSDAEIKHAVLQELAWDTRVKETEVGPEKRAILGAIRHAPGVEAVDDHLRIDPVR